MLGSPFDLVRQEVPKGLPITTCCEAPSVGRTSTGNHAYYKHVSLQTSGISDSIKSGWWF